MPSSKKSTSKTAKKRTAVKYVNTPNTKSSRSNRLFTLMAANKLITALVLVVALLLGALVNQKYQDWDNAQMIKGLARDFPALVAEIESATGLDLEVKYDCMKTQEKFNDGVNVCELRYYAIDESNDDAVRVFEVISKNNNFIKGNIFSNQEGYKFNYRNKRSCSFTNRIDVYGSCIIGVRETNLELAKNLLVK